jgi:virginiamycin B lyase
MQDFSVPHIGTAAVHSAVPAADGSVWLAEQGSNKLGRWDPATQKITEYPDAYIPGKEGLAAGGTKHTIRVDNKGRVWASGEPFSMFDPETGKYTHFDELKNTYDVFPDKNGDIWFTFQTANQIGKIDGKTLKVTKWNMPTPDCFARRMAMDADGIIWIGEFNAGKIARFDPAAQTFKEFPLPGPDPTPYALGIDANGYIWYNSHRQDVIGRLDPKSGKVTEYPFPHPELSMREFFLDAHGRMWYGTNPNNKVGYFYLAGKNGSGMASGR